MVSGLNQTTWEPPLIRATCRRPLPGLKEPALVCGPDATVWMIWLEQRPQERGRTTALIRRFGDSEAPPRS